MHVGSQTEWDARIPAEEIQRRKDLCLRRLGIEIAPYLKPGRNTVVFREEVREEKDFGLERTIYRLYADVT